MSNLSLFSQLITLIKAKFLFFDRIVLKMDKIVLLYVPFGYLWFFPCEIVRKRAEAWILYNFNIHNHSGQCTTDWSAKLKPALVALNAGNTHGAYGYRVVLYVIMRKTIRPVSSRREEDWQTGRCQGRRRFQNPLASPPSPGAWLPCSLAET
jgi:hypothetical protein